MTAYGYTLGVKAAVITSLIGMMLLASGTVAAMHDLNHVASQLTGQQVTVQRGKPPTTEAATYVSENRIVLRPWIWNALAKETHRTPWALAVFAHEIGHIATGPDDSENSAACWARANVYRTARMIGFGPYRAKVHSRLARQDQLLYCEP